MIADLCLPGQGCITVNNRVIFDREQGINVLLHLRRFGEFGATLMAGGAIPGRTVKWQACWTPGILIPPSILAILYAVVAQQSIGERYMG